MKQCRKCNQIKPLSAFALHPKGRFGRNPRCRDCKNQEAKVFFQNNRETILAQQKISRRKFAGTKYGMTPAEYASFKAAHNVCGICGRDVPLVTDHDHETGLVRGRLCTRCNTGLGKFLDSASMLREAINYLEGIRLDEELAR